MTDLSRRLSEETSKIRIAATALMLSVGLYALAWGVMISATLYGAWTSPVLGVDLPGAVSALSLRQLIQVYATMLAVAAGAATSLVWPRAGWIIFAAGAALHITVWVERVGSPYYEGGPGFIFLGLGLLALGLQYRYAFRADEGGD